MWKHLEFAALILAFLASTANANICGTDYQIFNPTTNGLDFVTVQSSETLRPCFINTGLFLNYAANSMTYSNTINSNVRSGTKPNDTTLGADLSIGMGITDRWDFGVNMPMMLDQQVRDEHNVSAFNKKGLTEIKANTKYRFLGDENGGLAGIFSVNQNLIQDNPFAGKGGGPTWNFELAADTMLEARWALGANIGYRARNPGTQIAGQPFAPMGDQYIYSLAASYLLASLDTKVIFEIYGSRAAQSWSNSSDRSMNALEGLIGFKHDLTQGIAAHVGFSKGLDAAMGGPDWRVYAGMNWAIGPVCGTGEMVAGNPGTAPSAPSEVYNMQIELLFETAKDQLNKESLGTLDKFAKHLATTGYQRVVIEGHTDSVGPEEYNEKLSQRRANNVRKYLIDAHKLNPASVEAIGYGEAKPVADNGNYQGRSKNRRVEFKIWRK